MRQFVYTKKNGEPSRSVGLAAVMLVAGMRCASVMVSYRFRINEEQAGPENKRRQVLKKLRWHCKTSKVGDVFRIYTGAVPDGPLFRVHAVQPPTVVVDINGNHNADVYYTYITTTWKNFDPRFAGSYVCKDVAGTSTPSQHSYGNADDFFFDSLTHQDVVATDVVAHAGQLNVHTVISRQRIWTAAEGWHTYTGDYHSHLHADFDPQFSGSCGIREP